MSRQFVYKKVYVAYTFIYSTYNYASQTHGIMQCVYGTNEYNPHKKYCCNLFRTQKKISTIYHNRKGRTQDRKISRIQHLLVSFYSKVLLLRPPLMRPLAIRSPDFSPKLYILTSCLWILLFRPLPYQDQSRGWFHQQNVIVFKPLFSPKFGS